jgi:hypothetical protein
MLGPPPHCDSRQRDIKRGHIGVRADAGAAAKTGGLYHLWWHPHNFGYHPNECLMELKAILQHYTCLNKEYGLLSMNMKGLRNHLIKI